MTWACQTAPPVPQIQDLPDPLRQPVPGVQLTAREQRAVRDVVASLSRADWTRAGRSLADLPPEHPVSTLLRFLADHVRGVPVAGAAEALARRYPEYQAAWELAVLAARREGMPAAALALARERVRAGPEPEWVTIVAELTAEVCSIEMTAARRMLAEGDHGGALAALRRVLELQPGREEARRLAVKVALEARDGRAAAEWVAGLNDSPEDVELKAAVAENLGQWELALVFARQIPVGTPGRCERIIRAWEGWRLKEVPAAILEARAAEPARRRHLAAIMAWEAPELMERATGPVPVLEDVVQLPEAAEILVVVRAGVMKADLVVRRFYPERAVDTDELSLSLEGLARILGKEIPVWCTTLDQDHCLARPGRVDGAEIVRLVRRVVGLEESLCR